MSEVEEEEEEEEGEGQVRDCGTALGGEESEEYGTCVDFSLGTYSITHINLKLV